MGACKRQRSKQFLKQMQLQTGALINNLSIFLQILNMTRLYLIGLQKNVFPFKI